MITLILEAGFRSLLMALVVWGGIRIFRVQAVFAQKVAWVLVLVAAGVMPMVMRSPLLAVNRALNIPVQGLFHQKLLASASGQPTPAISASMISPAEVSHRPPLTRGKYKPSATHRAVAYASSDSDQNPAQNQASAIPVLQALTASSALTPVRPALDSVENSVRGQINQWTAARAGILFAIVYGLVGGVLLLRTLIGFVIAARIYLRATPIKSYAGDLADIDPTLRVRVSRDIVTPVTIASSVILPSEYSSWDEAKLRIVIAHEQSHVHQKDFYLQLLASVHAAAFWFSPLGWWLQHKLSDLGEALSDRAGLAQAPDAASYAEVLLEFAVMPRTNPFSRSFAGVAMARSTNLSSRIERILNDNRFRLAFLGGRRHAVLAAALVPAALFAAVACIHIVPAVHAAQTQKLTSTGIALSGADVLQAPIPAPAPAPAPVEGVADPAPVSGVAEPTPAPEPTPEAEAQETLNTPETEAPEPPSRPKPAHGFAYGYGREDGQNSFAIVDGNGNSNVYMNGKNGEALEKVRNQYHGSYIWFERDGKSYVITDPAILAQSRELFKGNEPLQLRQEQLQKMQEQLDKKMQELKPEMVNLNTPEFKAQMEKLNAELADLQKVKIKEITDKVNAEVLANLQEKMGDIQGQIGEIQGQIGEQQGLIGEKQGAIGEQMGRLGEEMGKIGEQQGKIAEEASRKLQSVFDQAIKDGKAKPVN